MASSSGSLRPAADQSFSSRKKTMQLSKDEKVIEDAKSSHTVSPGAKGTLDGYLVKTPDVKSPPSARSHKNKSRAKRNLHLISERDTDPPSRPAVPVEQLAHGIRSPSRPNDPRDIQAEVDYQRRIPTETGFDRSDDRIGSIDLCTDFDTTKSLLEETASSKELKRFATDFLSLYCGELPSPANFVAEQKLGGCKRNNSPSVQSPNIEICSKKQRMKVLGDSPTEPTITKSDKAVIFPFQELNVVTEDRGAFSCLRKCSNTPAVSYKGAVETPGSFRASCNPKTPKSSYRSSLFSPGDEFWAEAIQVVDGFDACKDPLKPSEGRENILTEVDGFSKTRAHRLDISLKLTGKSEESVSHHYVSPLPVKHFDFSHEQRNFDEDKGNLFIVDEMKDAKLRGSEGIAVDISHLAETIEVKQITKDKPKFTNPPSIVSEESSTTLKLEIPNMACIIPVVGKEIKSISVVGEGKNAAGTPSSSMPLKDSVRLNTWIPSEVCSAYMKKGISALYQWQVDCLQIDGVLEKRNLVYCASTSAGKSLVAEILMLRRVISTQKMALLVLPYVSICAEKTEHLESLLEPLGKHVRSFYGNQGGGSLPKDTSVAVCTIEKANSLINRLLEEGRLSEVGVVVIDELHMVGDQHRGYLLELLLTKLRYASGEGNTEASSEDSSGTNSGKSDISGSLQIVGMSATMPNVAAVANWLQAALYQTEFRPVPLEEFIKVGNSIFNKKMEVIRKIPEDANLRGRDPDHIVKLCDEIVQEGHSVLIFCSSRKGCESTARHVAKYLKSFTVKSDDTGSVLDALRRCPAGLDPVLEETLPSGVAYHHAGLTVEEREIVESCYRSGLVRVLTATSTLAAGVNLPARRVIFRQARIGRDFIDGTRYKQMSGRAGRTGIDSQGESILICKQEEIKKITSMLNDSCPPLQSCLSEDKNGMTHAILEVVAGGIVQTPNDINRYVRCTLLNSTRPFEAVVKSAQDSLRWLCRNKFLEWEEKSQLYTATPLGRASFGSSLNPEESLIVLDDLGRAREGFVLASDLHIVYLVTPINVDVEPDWELYYERFMELSNLDLSVGNRVGVTEPFLMRISHGAPMHISERLRGAKTSNGRVLSDFQKSAAGSSGRVLSDDRTLRVAKRFYVALMLSRLVQEVPMADVCDAFKVSRGMIQSLQENAGRFALMVSSFCERLGWGDLGGLVAKFQNRVSFGVRSEIVELTNIPYVKGSRARALYRAGLRTAQAIAEASIPDIVKALFESSSWSSHESTALRRIQLGMAKKIKNGARKIVLDQAEEARLAAFSAFKSLGVDIPQLSCPIVPSDGQNNRPEFDGLQNKDSNAIKDDFSANSGASKENKEASISLTHVPVGFPKPDQGQIYGEHRISCSLNPNSQRKGPMNARSFSGGFDSFLKQWDGLREFYFDLHFTKRSEQNLHLPYEILGMSVCWKESPVYYISLPKDLISSSSVRSQDDFWREANNRWDKIHQIMSRFGVKKFTWNLKCQIQVLKLPGISVQKFGAPNLELRPENRFKLVDNSHILLPKVLINDVIDMCLVAWILWPDEESKSGPNLEKTAKKHLTSEVAAAATRDGKWRNQMRLVAHNGCCRRVAQIRALGSVLYNLLIPGDLVTPLTDIENPLVQVLADMEHHGIGVDIEACLQARQILGRKVRELEKEAYRLAGRSFSLYTSADIANILYTHLKLPIPEGTKGKQHPSTDKHILELLRCHHPIVPIIKEHRTLAKLLNSTLGSICSKAKLNVESQRYIVRGHWLQTSTATGRLSIEDPNLQCIEHTLKFTMDSSTEEHHQINARDFFVPTQEKWVLLVADYSQIELRLVAHFSRDSSLVDLLSKPDGDVFTMIAARWTGKSESTITSEEREHTKRLLYGILYGMGANSLAEQLDCGVNEAAEKIQSFMNSFPAVNSWLQEAVSSCRHKGYVVTIRGRKRFLSKIQSGNKKEKAKAERQAVNSICQGSAADIIKIAMIKIHSMVSEESGEQEYVMLKGRCHILLQVHDELVLEVDPSVVHEASRLLQSSMESAIQLSVPLRAKMKVGRTWGSLKPLDVNL